MNILILFHTPVNSGYAMGPLEKTFYEVCSKIAREDKVFFAFREYNGEKVQSLPDGFKDCFELNPEKLTDIEYRSKKLKQLRSLNIDFALCFDLQVSSNMTKLLRESGVSKIASYWGSTISGLNNGIKLLLKKVEVKLSTIKPDLFIFESEAMRHLATHGRGIPIRMTQVIPTGVDTSKWSPDSSHENQFLKSILASENKRIAIYSGHMEERKGVHVLIEAFKELYDNLENRDWHLVICGNRPGEEDRFIEMLKGSKAFEHVTFCGYRKDLNKLMPLCDVGLIGSTGWDSFPMSALEMASCGLPIVVSELQGLKETVENKVTGILFEPGNSKQLAEILNDLGSNSNELKAMSEAARKRIERGYSLNIQKENLYKALSTLIKSE